MLPSYTIRYLLFLLLIPAATLMQARKIEVYKYRIRLTDKAATNHTLTNPETYLSTKAINRRLHQHLPIDSTDLPVCTRYINEIQKTGVRIVTTGKWNNFVTIACKEDTACLHRIAKLPFVHTIEKVWTEPPKNNQPTPQRASVNTQNLTPKDNPHGPALQQIQPSNGHLLHQAGFKGQGMTIAVIDAGFHNADLIPLFKRTHIAGTKDFVNPNGNVYAESSHGLKVLSCMGANLPGILTGSAPEATYFLLRTEDEETEHPVEQDYWAAAVEYADSLGADLINSSLGYHIFTDSTQNYTYRQLDGTSTLISQQASLIADKGMIMVCSAGNAGNGTWKKITPPADACHTLTVGAVDKNALLAPFSSIGNTADNRIKPDIVAVGVACQIAEVDGSIGQADGTSFSCPIQCGLTACLWQALPRLTAKQIITIVRQAGDRATFPDNIYGYGLPNMWKAYTTLNERYTIPF